MGARALKLPALLEQIRACRHCERDLPLGPRPVLVANVAARLLIAGQAPGTKVHASGIPWNDPSGDRLRAWLGIDRATFYDETKIAIVPMGFCYPGRGKSGDLPPRPECSELWHSQLLPLLPKLELTLAIGSYAQEYHLGARRKQSLTETVRACAEYLPRLAALPHPSPRNTLWLRNNPWFEEDCLPKIRRVVRKLLK